MIVVDAVDTQGSINFASALEQLISSHMELHIEELIDSHDVEV